VVATGGLAVGMALVMSLPVAAQGQRSGGARGILHGNTAKALLSQSSKLGPAPTSAAVDLLLGLSYVTPTSLPSLPQFITDTVTPGSPYFHHFLSETAFVDNYDQPAPNVAALRAYLADFGISVTKSYSNRIEAVGSVGEVEQAFKVTINNYLAHGHSYFANQENPTLPTAFAFDGHTYDLAQEVSGISGMTTYSAIHVMSVNRSELGAAAGAPCQSFCSTPIGYSPQAIADHYEATSLQDSGITGSGETIAVATLAPLLDSDAEAFWNYYNIPRTGTLSQVSVDHAPTDQAIPGSGGSESSLDVERSGAMAPGADIIAYIGQNTNNGFVDLFDKVATQDLAQVMTTSWGEAEQDETAGYATLLNQAFEQGAAEGISMFAASGDYGAYDAYPQYKTLAVDSPASSTYITAAGGTTLPSSPRGVLIAGTAGNKDAVYGGPTSEAAWGWSYLLPFYHALGLQNVEQARRALYPVGSGGGYSIYFSEPSWQQSVQQTGQRATPDVALDADPFTGYAIYDSGSDYSNSSSPWSNGWGGTSFSAPQWAGITALLDQATGSPIGLASELFYNLPPQTGGTVQGFTAITSGNNWGYSATAGWSPTTGLGVPDVAALAQAITTYYQG
jgi:kumamolisin